MLDMLLFNGMVRTIEADGAVHEAIGVKDGRIAFVGSAAEAAKLEAAQRIADQAQQLNAAAMQKIALPAPKESFFVRLFKKERNAD